MNGEPSFLSGGDPESEVLRYWLQLRPALLLCGALRREELSWLFSLLRGEKSPKT